MEIQYLCGKLTVHIKGSLKDFPLKTILLATQSDNDSGDHCSLPNYLCRKIVSRTTQQASYCLPRILSQSTLQHQFNQPCGNATKYPSETTAAASI